MANSRRSRSVRALAALLFSAALFAAGCGGSDSSDSTDAGADAADADTSDDQVDEQADDQADEQGDDQADDAGSDGEPDDEPAETSSTTTTTTTAAPPDGDPAVVAYCIARAEAEVFADSLENPLDPEEVEAWAKRSVELLDDVLPDAPAAIAEDLQILRRSFDEFLVVLEANDWDLLAASDELEALSDLPGPTAAEERIDAWEAVNCADVDVPGSDSVGSFEDAMASPEMFEAMLGSEAGRRLMIEGMTEDGTLNADQAECLLDNLDFETLASLAGGVDPTPELIAQFLDLIDTCDLYSLLEG